MNQDLINKHTKLLGIKGYTTNLLEKTDKEILDYYCNLVKIEHAFRIAKSDLEARPIFHHKENSIRNHLLICFTAVSLSVYLELKHSQSIGSIVNVLKSITDAKILNKATGKVIHSRVKKTKEIEDLEKMSY